jgi:hypothetical protein
MSCDGIKKLIVGHFLAKYTMEIEEVPEYIKRFMVPLCYGCDETSQCYRYGIDSGVYTDGDGRDDDPAEGIETKLMSESEAEVAEISELRAEIPAQMASHDASSDATSSEMDLMDADTFDDAIREALERKSASEINVAGSTGEEGRYLYLAAAAAVPLLVLATVVLFRYYAYQRVSTDDTQYQHTPRPATPAHVQFVQSVV